MHTLDYHELYHILGPSPVSPVSPGGSGLKVSVPPNMCSLLVILFRHGPRSRVFGRF